MKLLIGYDGSECSDGALGELEAAGLPSDVEALVMSVEERWLPPPSMQEVVVTGAGGIDTKVPASAFAERAKTALVNRHPEWNVTTEVQSGTPATALIERAHEGDFDLVHVGSHGLAALGRFLTGSVSQRVAAEAPCSVRVARTRLGRRPSHRLVIALDDSLGAQAAVRQVAERSWPSGTEVLLLTVFDRALAHSADLEGALGWIDQFQWAAASTLEAKGLEVSRLKLEGDPKRLIVEKAEALDADCIFVGSRGRGRFKRLLLGSVAAALVSRAHCSVEVVRERQ